MSFTPAEVEAFTSPTEAWLCPLSANTYGIEFLSFRISDYETKRTIFEVGGASPPPSLPAGIDLSQLDESTYRTIKYDFSEDFLRLPTVATSLVFSCGPRELEDFRMIERHYFRGQLVKSYDFAFGFVIPNSTNTWDAVYSLPPMDEALVEEMISAPYETVSDSFYFVGDELVMHNKAQYRYLREDAAQAKAGDDARAQSKGGAKGGDDKAYKGSKFDEDDGGAGEKWSKESDYY